MASIFTKSGNTFYPQEDRSSEEYPTLPAQRYLLRFSPLIGWSLEILDPAKLPEKLYGTHAADAGRILATFRSRPNTTGVALTGEKGSGKTMLTSLISNLGVSMEYPTIVINQPFAGDAFNTFITNLTQPCILLFDEFEKVYNAEQQQSILTLMDGVFASKKLFLLTANDQYKLDTHMKNRPGRIYYFLNYEGLDTDFVRDYCQDNLVNKSHIDSVCAVSAMFWRFNFDMLKAIVEEMNRYNETAIESLRYLNCKPESSNQANYEVKLKRDGKLVSKKQVYNGGKWQGNPLFNTVKVGWYDLDEDGDLDEYHNASFGSSDLVSMNGQQGMYQFKNADGEEVLLTKIEKPAYDYRASLAKVADPSGFDSFDIEDVVAN